MGSYTFIPKKKLLEDIPYSSSANLKLLCFHHVNTLLYIKVNWKSKGVCGSLETIYLLYLLEKRTDNEGNIVWRKCELKLQYTEWLQSNIITILTFYSVFINKILHKTQIEALGTFCQRQLFKMLIYASQSLMKTWVSQDLRVSGSFGHKSQAHQQYETSTIWKENTN